MKDSVEWIGEIPAHGAWLNACSILKPNDVKNRPNYLLSVEKLGEWF